MTLTSAPFELTARQQLLQFGHVLQQSLLPRLEQELGSLSASAQRLVEVLAAVPLQRWLPGSRTGRPKKTRTALAAAFLAKAVYGCTTTRQLREQMQVDEQMRRCCGWR